jgi:hypothetical protein
MNRLELDQILRPIAQNLSHHADEILDLREAAIKENNPGRCISCYYKLLADPRPESKPITTPLRRWLEQHLEVVAHDPAQQVLERLPVKLSSDDLEDYCQQVINEIRYDRGYHSLLSIDLSFAFKEEDKVGQAS